MINLTRIEKAENMLNQWAYRLYSNRKAIEKEYAVFTGASPMIQGALSSHLKRASSGISYKIDAKQTRNNSSSMMPPGVARIETYEARCLAVDEILSKNLSPRSRLMAFHIFLPRSIYGAKIKDKQIAIAAGFSPKRASEIKIKSIKLIAEAISPINHSADKE